MFNSYKKNDQCCIITMIAVGVNFKMHIIWMFNVFIFNGDFILPCIKKTDVLNPYYVNLSINYYNKLKKIYNFEQIY